MKIRHGFVSNSSTTSFCIVGRCYTSNDDTDEIPDIQGIEQYRQYDSEYCYIGIDIEKMQDNETLLQFKQKVLEKLRKIPQFKDTKIEEIGILVDGWRDT